MRSAYLIVALSLAAAGVAAAQDAPAGTAEAEREHVVTGDYTVEVNQSVEDVVVVGGDLTVRGEVTGDAVVVGGDLLLEETGTVQGDAVVTGGEIHQNGGRVRGEMRTLSDVAGAVGVGRGASGDDAREMREEARELRDEMRREARGRDSGFGPFRRGLIGLISIIALGLVLAAIGAVFVFFGRPYLETVSDTLRSNTLRSGAVGLAACFLIVPVFVVLIVALAVTIVGIPLLLVAVPLYPLLVAAAAAMGLLAAAHAIGERTAEQTRRPLEMRFSNSYAYLFTGLGMLLAPMVAANLIRMTGFLGFLGVLLLVVTGAVIWVATTAGLGAVILSRVGTRRTFVRTPVDTMYEADPLLDDEAPAAGGSRV